MVVTQITLKLARRDERVKVRLLDIDTAKYGKYFTYGNGKVLSDPQAIVWRIKVIKREGPLPKSLCDMMALVDNLDDN